MARRSAWTIATTARRFTGWAAQPGQRTVQGELEAALERILGEPVALTVAGRTDAGVHAWARWRASARPASCPTLARRLNAGCRPGSPCSTAEAGADGFDARRDARSRTYCYRIVASPVPSPFEQRRALRWPHPLDRAALESCARPSSACTTSPRSRRPTPSTCASSAT